MHNKIATVLMMICFFVDEIVENLISFERGMLKINVAPTVVAISSGSGENWPPTNRKQNKMKKNLLAAF